jgi:serine/threonine-protein kinase
MPKAKHIPKIKDLENGNIKCPHCSSMLPLKAQTPLKIHACASCGAPVFYPYQLADYWLYEPLGGGGMGSVYKAMRSDSKKEFAVKILPKDQTNNPELINALLREGEAAMNFGDHSNLVAVEEYGDEQGEYFLVSEFVQGRRLDIFIETEGVLSEKETIEFAMQILKAEMHISNCGYLFRDLKPKNIIVDQNNRVRLFDYGLCITHQAARQYNDLEGSPYYIPPERVVGAPEGEYSEIYSLGLLMYYMLTGKTYYTKPLFSKKKVQLLVRKHVTFPRLASVEMRLKSRDPRTAKIIDKMIERKPSDRYPNFEILNRVLEKRYQFFNKKRDTQIFIMEVSAVVLMFLIIIIIFSIKKYFPDFFSALY